MTTHYFVHSADNNHVGPVSADLIARGVLAGKIASGTFVAPAGTASWLPFETVGEVVEAIAARSSLPPPPPPPIEAAAEPAETVEGLPPPNRYLPLAVFGGFAAVGVLETILAFVIRR